MILHEFDPAQSAVINPWDICAPLDDCPGTVVACFPANLTAYAAEHYGGAEIASTASTNGSVPLYRIRAFGETLGLTMALVGAPGVVGQFEELFALGAERIVVFGTCGVLDSRISDCAILLPDRAVRDEGVSYHYAPPSDEIGVNAGTLDMMAQFFAEKRISHTVGKVWTTDAFYRETREKVDRRRAAGCMAVEMECSALAALAQFRKKKIAHFLYAADNLDREIWDRRSLDNEDSLDAKHAIVRLALELAARWEGQSRCASNRC